MIDSRLVTLREIRRLLEGGIPPAMCSVSDDGVPHVNYVSHVEYVDDDHVALSYQFLNRSRANVLATRRIALSIDDAHTCAGVVMHLEYLRTESSGPTFERIRAKLAGIAAHSGMEKIFKLLGADVYLVREVRERCGLATLPALPSRCDLASGARELSRKMADCTSLADLLDTFTDGLLRHLCIQHGLVWLLDEQRQSLFTLASLGYPESGVGAELSIDDAGLAAVALREGVPIRIGHMALMYRYGIAWRRRVDELGLATALEREVPLPGLPAPRSQLAVPLRAVGRTVGVLLLESENDQFFTYDDEDLLSLIGAQLANALIHQRLPVREEPDLEAPAPADPDVEGKAIVVRHFPADDSVFIDDEYLIKGVAGAIFWKIASEYVEHGRTDFTTRELRLAGDALRLPEVQDNLGVRLLLLQRRLEQREGKISIERTGRGRFRLVLAGHLCLIDGGSG